MKDFSYIGDRTLTVFLGNGFFHATTYTYNTLNDKTNLPKNTRYSNADIENWFFIY